SVVEKEHLARIARRTRAGRPGAVQAQRAALPRAGGGPVGFDLDAVDEQHAALVDPRLERVVEAGEVLPPEALVFTAVVVDRGGGEAERARVVGIRVARAPLEGVGERGLLKRGALERLG